MAEDILHVLNCWEITLTSEEEAVFGSRKYISLGRPPITEALEPFLLFQVKVCRLIYTVLQIHITILVHLKQNGPSRGYYSPLNEVMFSQSYAWYLKITQSNDMSPWRRNKLISTGLSNLTRPESPWIHCWHFPVERDCLRPQRTLHIIKSNEEHALGTGTRAYGVHILPHVYSDTASIAGCTAAQLSFAIFDAEKKLLRHREVNRKTFCLTLPVQPSCLPEVSSGTKVESKFHIQEDAHVHTASVWQQTFKRFHLV